MNDIIRMMKTEHKPIEWGYYGGGILGLLLGGFLADTWLWFAVVAFSSLAGGTLAGWLASSIITRLAHRRGEL
ncbi:MAG: hypothetical protein ACE5KR_00815 [Candidatus Bipolaricaulia bacterium]